MADITPYLALITREHAHKPKFVRAVATSVQPFADVIAVLTELPAQFDVDVAVGDQLDIVGELVGVSRFVSSALTNVYFTFDSASLGFDLGVIWAPGDPLTGLSALPDDIYRLLIKAQIVANYWNGSIPQAYEAWNSLFAANGYQILIQDNGDMTMLLALQGQPAPVFLQLFMGSYLDLKPAGVRIAGRVTPTADAPFFGFDAENTGIAGFDVGAFGKFN